VVQGVFLPCMYENTYASLVIGKTFAARIGTGALADYLRWEYRPADRSSVLAAFSRSDSRGLFGRIALRLRPAAKAVRVDARRPHGVRRPLRLSGRVVSGRTRYAVP
jgi:hypothetical protein